MHEVEEHMDFIADRLEKLKDLMKDAALLGFDDDNSKHESIEVMAGSITDRFGKCQRLVKGMGVEEKKNTSPEEAKAQKNAQIALATRLQQLSIDFRKSQKSYMDRLKGTETRIKTMFNGLDNEDDEDQPINMDFDDNQMNQVQEQIRLVSQREEEINQLARSIAELAQIFQDMSVLVLDQGTIVDRIDYNIQQTVILTEEAHKELVESNKQHKKYRTKLCILLLIAVAVALVLTLMFRPTTTTDTSTPAPTTTETPAPTAGPVRDLSANVAAVLRSLVAR